MMMMMMMMMKMMMMMMMMMMHFICTENIQKIRIISELLARSICKMLLTCSRSV